MNVALKITVATFNIKHSAVSSGYIGKPWLLGEACAEINADILALQEVDNRVWRSWFSDTTKLAAGNAYRSKSFARAMGANIVSLINPGGSYGLALLVKGDIVSEEVLSLRGDFVRLPFGKRRNVAPEPRIATLSTVRTDTGVSTTVVNTHFGGPLRETFFNMILSRLEDYDGRKIILGDENTGRPDIARWIGAAAAHYELAERPSELPIGYRQSDHIAVQGFSVSQTSARWTPLSDHPAIIAELTTIQNI